MEGLSCRREGKLRERLREDRRRIEEQERVGEGDDERRRRRSD